MIDLSVWKKKIVIVPFKGAGPIRFGMSKEQLVKIAGEPSHISKTQSSSDGFPLEYFSVRDSGKELVAFSVGYRGSLLVQSVEFFSGENVIFHGLRILAPTTTNQQVGDLIRRLDPNVYFKMYEGGAVHDYRSLRCGMDLYSESGEPDEPIDAVHIFDQTSLTKVAGPKETDRIVASILGGDYDA